MHDIVVFFADFIAHYGVGEEHLKEHEQERFKS